MRNPPQIGKSRVLANYPIMSSVATSEVRPDAAQEIVTEAVADESSELGHFGAFGGQFVPETLMVALRELEETYLEAIRRSERFAPN